MLGVVLLGSLGFGAKILLLLAISYLCQEYSSKSHKNNIGRNHNETRVMIDPPEDDNPNEEGDQVVPECRIDNNGLIILREAQQNVLSQGRLSQEHLKTNMVIGIHATLKTFAAYCINLQSKQVRFYNVQKAHFPWQLFDLKESTEFQMRNFSFALMAFYDEILVAKRFSIYVASTNTTFDNNRLGRRATKLLDHYITCEGTSVINEGNHFLSQYQNEELFAINIGPAEDLSGNNLEPFITFISLYYGIPRENFLGSHIVPGTENDIVAGPSSMATERYQGYIDKVKQLRLRFAQPCGLCGYFDNEVTHRTSNAGIGTMDWNEGITV